MRTLLRDYEGYQQVGNGSVSVRLNNPSREVRWFRPRLPIVPGFIAFWHILSTKVHVQALLDTGCDITIVKPEKVWELEKSPHKRRMLPATRHIAHDGEFQPAVDLAFLFSDNDCYSSRFGMIVTSKWKFDVADMWLGQEILRQLVVTFDGVQGTVTIIDPKDRSSSQ